MLCHLWLLNCSCFSCSTELKPQGTFNKRKVRQLFAAFSPFRCIYLSLGHWKIWIIPPLLRVAAAIVVCITEINWPAIFSNFWQGNRAESQISADPFLASSYSIWQIWGHRCPVVPLRIQPEDGIPGSSSESLSHCFQFWMSTFFGKQGKLLGEKRKYMLLMTCWAESWTHEQEEDGSNAFIFL